MRRTNLMFNLSQRDNYLLVHRHHTDWKETTLMWVQPKARQQCVQLCVQLMNSQSEAKSAQNSKKQQKEVKADFIYWLKYCVSWSLSCTESSEDSILFYEKDNIVTIVCTILYLWSQHALFPVFVLCLFRWWRSLRTLLLRCYIELLMSISMDFSDVILRVITQSRFFVFLNVCLVFHHQSLGYTNCIKICWPEVICSFGHKGSLINYSRELVSSYFPMPCFTSSLMCRQEICAPEPFTFI